MSYGRLQTVVNRKPKLNPIESKLGKSDFPLGAKSAKTCAAHGYEATPVWLIQHSVG